MSCTATKYHKASDFRQANECPMDVTNIISTTKARILPIHAAKSRITNTVLRTQIYYKGKVLFLKKNPPSSQSSNYHQLAPPTADRYPHHGHCRRHHRTIPHP